MHNYTKIRMSLLAMTIMIFCFVGNGFSGENTSQKKVAAVISTEKPIIDKVFPLSPKVLDNTAGFTFNNSITTFDDTRWYSKWHEVNVFKTELNHANSTNPYALRVGKGGQLYSIMTPIGEIAPPQNPDHAWIDDTYLSTIYQYDLDPDIKGVDALTAFIHSCGMYPHKDIAFQQGKQFWSPIVGEKWDAEKSEFSTISLGMISTGPSLNRGDVLFYQKIKDMGDGVFEITTIAYNYNTSYTNAKQGYITDLCPWGGVRTSKLPNLILSNPDQTWKVSNNQFGDNNSLFYSDKTGGWAIATQNPNLDTSYSLGLVFGQNNPESRDKFYTCGKTDVSRSFTVQAVTYREVFKPGNTFYCRQYYVLGKLKDVVEKCKKLESYTSSGFLKFDQTTATSIPLYLTEKDGQTIISEEGTTPAFYVYAEPVKDSKPLYLIRNTATNKLHVTCDPYMIMPRYTIDEDPLKRKGIRPYDGTTEILKLYGFVMPSAFSSKFIDYKPLNSILTDKTFFTEKGIYDLGIMVRNKLDARLLEVKWDGEAADGLWSSALNWSNNKLPSDSIIITLNTKAKVDAIGMANSGYLPAHSYTTVSGGATLTVSGGAIRMNNNNLDVAADGALEGEWWDLNNGTLSFEDGASVNIKNWENKGTNVFNLKLGSSGFKTLKAAGFYIGSGTTIANATYNVDMANYTGGEDTIVLIDYIENKAGLTAEEFKKAKLNILNVGSFTNSTLSFDERANDIVLIIRRGDEVVGVKWDGEAGDGLWTSALNWSTNKLPGNEDHIILDKEEIVDTYGMPNSGYLPANCTIDISGGATLTNSIGAIRLNGSTVNVSSTGSLAGDFWDMSNGAVNFVDGAVVDLAHWEVKGKNTFGFKLSATGFNQVAASAFRSGNSAVWADVTFNIDITDYKISNGASVVLADFNYHDPAFDGTFNPTVNVISGNSNLGGVLSFNKIDHSLVLTINTKTGVNALNISNDVKVNYNNSAITITGETENYKIINLVGQVISQGLTPDIITRIPFDFKGIVIVCGTKKDGTCFSQKVLVL